tara:strand:+ start:798 stop:1181 length:384 start_codon:yes stop_codon:yes gene_type:complete
MNLIYVLIIVLFILLICSLFCYDHFKPINSLNIKYNSKQARNPDFLKKPTPRELTLKEKITSELNSQPLMWQDNPGQIFASPKYPHVGPLKRCNNNSDCSSLSSKCNNEIGFCTIAQPNKTVFDINY